MKNAPSPKTRSAVWRTNHSDCGVGQLGSHDPSDRKTFAEQNSNFQFVIFRQCSSNDLRAVVGNSPSVSGWKWEKDKSSRRGPSKIANISIYLIQSIQRSAYLRSHADMNARALSRSTKNSCRCGVPMRDKDSRGMPGIGQSQEHRFSLALAMAKSE